MSLGFRLFLLVLVAFGAAWVYHSRESEIAGWLGLDAPPGAVNIQGDLSRSPIDRVWGPETRVTLHMRGRTPDPSPSTPGRSFFDIATPLHAGDPAEEWVDGDLILRDPANQDEAGYGVHDEGEGLPPYRDDPPEPPAPDPIEDDDGAVDAVDANGEPLVYTVVAGDMLSKIAARFLGTGNRYREIKELNKDVLGESDRLMPGMKLRIPPR